MEQTRQDIDGRSTCPHGDAVMWNPYNKVVQCHRCGQQFTPDNQTAPADAVYGFAAWLTARKEKAGPFSRYDEAAQAAELADEYCRHNGWEVSPSGPKGFTAPEKDRLGFNF